MCNDTTVSKFKNDFHYTLSKFSHELRNPLTLINSGLQMIASAHPEVKEYEHWDDVMDNLDYVKELLNEKYDVLAGIDCIGFKDDSNQKLLQDINSFLEQYYDKIRHKVKEQELKNQLSFTLITKILMGTLGCVPAYDRYFIAGIKNQKVATGNYNLKSIMQLVDFYEKNFARFEPVREKMEVEGMPYPQMKMIDMGFWQVGLELDTNKRIQTAH